MDNERERATEANNGAETIKDAERAAQENISHEVPFKDYFMVSLSSGLGYAFDAYAVNIFGLVLPLIIVSLGIGTSLAGLIGSMQLIGYTLGTIGFGIAADRLGRRDTLGASILLYGITTSLGGMTHNFFLFTLLRFLTGVGGAGELAVGAPYTAEMWPKKVRAIGVGGIIFSLYSLGYIIAGGAALFIVPRWGWEWAFIVAIVPALLVFALRLFLQESTRYVIEKTQHKMDAAQTLHEVQQATSARERAKTMRRIQKEAEAEETSTMNRRERLKHMIIPGRPGERIWDIPLAKKRIGIGWLLYVANATGYWALAVFLTTFMTNKFGISAADAIKWAIAFYALQFFFAYLGTGLSDLIGRRVIGILGALIMITVTILAATADTFTGFVIFGGLMIAMLGWLWGLADTYISELFPTRIRGAGFGISVGGGRLVSIFAPFMVGFGIAYFGSPTIPFLLTSGLWVLTIIGYAIGPETKGKELEEITAEMDGGSARTVSSA